MPPGAELPAPGKFVPVSAPHGLFGRDDEIRRLVAAIDQRRSCVVTGAPGIGKTALLDRAVTSAREPVRRGRAFEMLRSEPYLALQEALGVQLTGEPPEVVRNLGAALRNATLVVDDVQWCDPDTVAVLEELVTAVPVIITLRHTGEEVAGLIARMTGLADRIELGPLGVDAIRSLLEAEHPGAPRPDLERWTLSAVGNPLAAQLAARSASVVDVAEVVAGILGELDDAAREAAARLALHGLPLVLPEAVGRVLIAADLAVSGPGKTYELRHPLIAAGVVAALDDVQRARLHQELALTTADASRHARHLADAGDERAAAVARLAARRAPTIASRAALLLLAAQHDPELADASALDAAEALLRSARYSDVISVLGSRPFADPDDVVRAELMLAHAYWAETRIDEARTAIERLRGVRADTPDALLVEVLTLECRILSRIDWERDAALTVGRRAVDLARRVGQGELSARSALSLAMLLNGDDEWFGELERAQALVSSADDLHEAVVVADTLLFGHLVDGDAEQCRPIADRMIELTEGVSPAWNGYFRAASLLAAVIVDGNGEAARDAGPALLARPLTVRSREMATWSLALAFADAGRDAEALPLARRAVEVASDPSARATALFALAETQWLGGRPADALAAALECAALPVRGFPGQVNAALIGAWSAADLDLEIDPALVEVARSHQHRNLRGAALEFEALLAADPAAAGCLFTEAAAASQHTSRRAAARAHFGAGRAALRAGDIESARVALAAAADYCAAHRLVALDGRVRAAARVAGAGSTASRGTLPSVRERVLRHVAAGATTTEIAASLHVSPSTVETHIRSALRASGATTRAQAASAVESARGPRCTLCRTPEELTRARAPFLARDPWPLNAVSTAPWDLATVASHVVVWGIVADDTTPVFLAATRGLQVVVCVPDAQLATVLEQTLDRLGGFRWFDPAGEPADRLSAEEHAIVAALAAGASGEDARQRLGFSRRTLSRRLATIRSTLGVSTTAEAVTRWTAATGGP
jgi:DNA-binding NarL/FixJ family response regulator